MQNDPGQTATDFKAAAEEISARLGEETRTATEALHDARDGISRKAAGYVSEAKDALFERAEGTQRDISSNLSAFGGALRAASEHLANSEQATASKFILSAAGGLESLSTSLKNKPFEDVLGDVRSFGKNNAAALIAASVLGGLALGRFIKSSTPETSNRGGMSDDSFHMDAGSTASDQWLDDADDAGSSSAGWIDDTSVERNR